MKVAVTGGCGYIGSVLLPKLQFLVNEVDVVDLKKPPPALLNSLNPKQYHFHNIDVSDPSTVKSVVSRSDFIIHLAALVGYPACNRDPELAVRCNVHGTQTLLGSKRPSTPLLLTSTISNYGPQNGSVDEQSELRPTSVYGETKKRAEELVRKESHHIIFRYAGAFGLSPTMRHDNLVHDFVSKAATGQCISVYESHFVRQFIHVDDMADAVVFALTHWGKLQGETYNVGNPEIEITKRQLVERIAECKTFPYKFENSGSDLEQRNYVVSFNKFTQAGFHPHRNLDAGICELIRHYESKHRMAA